MSDLEESTNLDAVETSEKPSKSKVRQFNTQRKNLEFEQARDFIRNQQLPSVKAYYEWWDANKPKMLPRRPERAYQHSWQGWNDFLGNDNQWRPNQQRNYRSYTEAILFVHKLKLTTQNEWLEWCQDNEVPEDIPKRPDMYYDEWMGWGQWLGNNAVTKVKAHQMATENRVALFYIAQETDVTFPINVYTFGVEMEGVAALREKWKKGEMRVFKLFWHDPTQMDAVQQIVNALSTPWYGNDKQRVCSNIHSICWELEMILEVARF